MNASVLRKTLPTRASGRLVLLLLLAAVLMGLAAAVVLDPLPSIPAEGAVETTLPANTRTGRVSAPKPWIDHAAVDWDRVPMEPDPSPLSVAAYGN